MSDVIGGRCSQVAWCSRRFWRAWSDFTGNAEARRQAQLAPGAQAKERAREEEKKQRTIAEANEKIAQNERAHAVAAAAAEKAANQQAQKRLAQIEKANEILGSIFEGLHPKEIAKNERPLQAIIVEKIDKAISLMDGEAIGDPLVMANMQNRFGLSLVGLGEPDRAIVLFQKARETFKEKVGPDHPDTLRGMGNLALAYVAAGKFDIGLALSEESQKATSEKLGPNHPYTLVNMNNLVLAYQAAGKPDLALPLAEKTLKAMKATFGPDHPVTLKIMGNLALVYESPEGTTSLFPFPKRPSRQTSLSSAPIIPTRL